MRRALLLTAAVLTLAACGARREPDVRIDPPAAETVAAEDAAAGWTGATDAGRARLTYGPPNTDDVRLMLVCVAPGTVEISAPVRGSSANPAITLASGATRSSFLASAGQSVMGDGTLLTARTSVRDPVLRDFAGTGRISVVEGTTVQPMPADAGELATVRAFFAACGG